MTTGVLDRPWPAVFSRWIRLVDRRVHERQFWVVQVLVLAVASLHIAVEASHLQERLGLGGLMELPVVLHIIPVVYAGFRYGYEGSVLTGLWSGVLAVPNIVLWHSEGFGWLTDLVFIAFVIALGVVIAVPVERERHQRRLAEAASRRLETLNRVAADLAATTDLRQGMTRALQHLMADLPLRQARLQTTEPIVGVIQIPETLGMGEAHPRADPVVVPLGDQPQHGTLVVAPRGQQPLQDDDRELLVAAARQIGSALEAGLLRFRERDRLRTYAREVTRAQERERSRIARDLHDVVAQELTLLARHLDDLDGRRGDGDASRLRAMVDHILDTVRHVSRELRPPGLEELGLVPTLRSLVTQLGTRADVLAELHVVRTPRRLPVEAELTLYRIVQEAVHNAERHAAPSRIDVTVTFADDHVEVAVSDDGGGFEVGQDLPAEAAEGGLGLLGMGERAELAGGRLRIESAPGGGTALTAWLPAGGFEEEIATGLHRWPTERTPIAEGPA